MSSIINGKPVNTFGTVELTRDPPLLLIGDATVWDDIRVPVTATRRQGSRDPDFVRIKDNGAGSQGVFAQAFDDSAEEELYFEVQMPHDWKIGTDIDAHVHWLPAANGGVGEVVNWGLELTPVSIGAVMPATTIFSNNVSLPNETLVADKHYLTDIADIDMSAITGVSAMISCRVFRDAAGSLKTDDYGDDAHLLEIDFHYQRDSLGSQTEFSK